jgi:hypothetical protein
MRLGTVVALLSTAATILLYREVVAANTRAAKAQEYAEAAIQRQEATVLSLDRATAGFGRCVQAVKVLQKVVVPACSQRKNRRRPPMLASARRSH